MINIYLRFNTFSEALTIASAFNPYFSINCSGVPLSPKVSLVATNSCGAGKCSTNVLETLSPKPPKKLCYSAVTTHPVFLTEAKIASSSNGLIV